MFDILNFFKKEESSKNVAKDRLKLVLVHDRANCSPEFLEMIKGDILNSIKQYIDYDDENLDIKIEQTTDENGKPALVANIPIKNMKRK